VSAGGAGDGVGGVAEGVEVVLDLLGGEGLVVAEEDEAGDELGAVVEDRGLDVVDVVGAAGFGVGEGVVFVAELEHELLELGVEFG
jgi:hypothetical protein